MRTLLSFSAALYSAPTSPFSPGASPGQRAIGSEEGGGASGAAPAREKVASATSTAAAKVMKLHGLGRIVFIMSVGMLLSGRAALTRTVLMFRPTSPATAICIAF